MKILTLGGFISQKDRSAERRINMVYTWSKQVIPYDLRGISRDDIGWDNVFAVCSEDKREENV